MTEAIVAWKKGIQFNGRAKGSSDLPLGDGPDDFRPLELLVIGLISCTAMDIISILEKKRQDVSAFEVKGHADREDDYPKAFTKARIEYLVSGRSVDEDAVLRAIELSVTRYCPASAMFSRIIPVEYVYSIFEDLGNGERKLTASGSYEPAEQPV